jgi:hypothetical protein
MTSYTDVSTDSEQTMISSLMQQLVSIAIEAFKSVIQLYKSRVLFGRMVLTTQPMATSRR